MSTPDYRALLQRLVNAIDAEPGDVPCLRENLTAAYRAAFDALLAAPEAVGVADEEWDALVERLWDQYETFGYQGERFMYCSDFGTAMDLARQEFSRFAHPAPVPVGERLPGVGDCNDEGEVWIEEPGAEYALGDTGDYDWDPHRYVLRCIEERDHRHNHRYLPHWALPLPGDQP